MSTDTILSIRGFGQGHWLLSRTPCFFYNCDFCQLTNGHCITVLITSFYFIRSANLGFSGRYLIRIRSPTCALHGA